MANDLKLDVHTDGRIFLGSDDITESICQVFEGKIKVLYECLLSTKLMLDKLQMEADEAKLAAEDNPDFVGAETHYMELHLALTQSLMSTIMLRFTPMVLKVVERCLRAEIDSRKTSKTLQLKDPSLD